MLTMFSFICGLNASTQSNNKRKGSSWCAQPYTLCDEAKTVSRKQTHAHGAYHM